MFQKNSSSSRVNLLFFSLSSVHSLFGYRFLFATCFKMLFLVLTLPLSALGVEGVSQ